jgi:hypothetical protein
LAWATSVIAEPAQHAPSGQQRGQQAPSGQQALSGQHDSLATTFVVISAQHGPSGQQEPSGQHAEGSVEMTRDVDRLYAATLPVTSRAKVRTLLAMIFVRIIVLQIIRSVVTERKPWPRKAHALGRPAQQAKCLSLNVVQEIFKY